MKEKPWIEPLLLEGKYVRLEPLKPRHARALAAAVDPETFKYFTTIIPRDHSIAGMKEYVARVRAEPMVVPFAVVSREIMRAVGVTTFMDIKPAHAGVEIGMTWLGKPWHGTKINPEAKLLLLEHAFERLNAERVQLKTDTRNLQSLRAIAKLGAVREGILRSLSRGPDGSMTDRVMFSVTKQEWPGVKQTLLKRLLE